MKKDAKQAFSESYNKQFDYFSKDMAEVTADAFYRGDNAEKGAFPGYFSGMWENYKNMYGIDIEKTIEGFKDLKNRLEPIYDEYKNRELNVAAKHTQVFIEVIDKLIIKKDAG
jgi:hypothetical protein